MISPILQFALLTGDSAAYWMFMRRGRSIRIELNLLAKGSFDAYDIFNYYMLTNIDTTYKTINKKKREKPLKRL